MLKGETRNKEVSALRLKHHRLLQTKSATQCDSFLNNLLGESMSTEQG